MVQSAESVVTPERYSQGMTYGEYVASIERNQKRFEENYAGTEIAPADVAAFKALMAKPNGPAKMMVIGEDWCPDVFRGMPVFAKLAEATGIDMRVFKRDGTRTSSAIPQGREHESIGGRLLHEGPSLHRALHRAPGTGVRGDADAARPHVRPHAEG
jgi:thiol-disulfide isomerase/thioredoxin